MSLLTLTPHTALAAALFLLGCGARKEAAVRPFQTELLDLAFKAASAFPSDPHLKNRARAQEVVVKALLALNEPERALAQAQRIDHWRRAACYAEVAHHFARAGDRSASERCLELASHAVSELEKDASAQSWPEERVTARIEATRSFLRQAGQVAAPQPVASRLAEQVKRLEGVVAGSDFDQVRGVLETLVDLHAEVGTEGAVRAQVEDRVLHSYPRLRLRMRMELWIRLVDSAITHRDSSRALELVEAAEAAIDAATWLPEDRIPLLARLAARRNRAGDAAGARRAAEALLSAYEAERGRMVDIARAGVLCPLAETFVSLGDRAVAQRLYERAVVESLENPNSRPRADALVAICCSLAIQAVDPDAALRAKLIAVCDGLGDPW